MIHTCGRGWIDVWWLFLSTLDHRDDFKKQNKTMVRIHAVLDVGWLIAIMAPVLSRLFPYPLPCDLAAPPITSYSLFPHLGHWIEAGTLTGFGHWNAIEVTVWQFQAQASNVCFCFLSWKLLLLCEQVQGSLLEAERSCGVETSCHRDKPLWLRPTQPSQPRVNTPADRKCMSKSAKISWAQLTFSRTTQPTHSLMKNRK